MEPTSADRTGLDRLLSIFADVRRGEGGTALLLMLNVFILLAAYYIIKPVREALILGEASAEIKSYSGAVQALLFVILVPIYSAVANRVSRVRLINGVTAFFMSNLVIFYALGQMNVRIGIPFFLWVGLFNVMLVAQVWAFANDLYTPEQGKRLLAITGIGASFGAILGAKVAGLLFEPLGSYQMMLLAAALLGVCIALTFWIHRRETSKQTVRERQAVEAPPSGGQGGFQLVFKHRYLFLIAIMVLLTNVVNTTGEFILGKAVKEHAESVVPSAGLTPEQHEENVGKYIGGFYSDFFFWVNLLGAGLQLFAVSRIMKYLGVSAALMFLPIIALGSYALLAFVPVLSFIRIVKIVENGTDYSIQNTGRHSLFLQTSREAKYKAKAAIDNFFWRAGDALSALVVFVGTQLALGTSTFAIANFVLVLVWLGVVLAIRRIRKSEQPVMTDSAAA